MFWQIVSVFTSVKPESAEVYKGDMQIFHVGVLRSRLGGAGGLRIHPFSTIDYDAVTPPVAFNCQGKLSINLRQSNNLLIGQAHFSRRACLWIH